MTERDTSRACLSGCLFAAAFLMSPAALVVFWAYTHEFRNGLLAGFITFCLLLAGSFGFMTQVREPSVFLTWAPFTAGAFYTVLPDAIPLPIDDAAAMAAGAIATFALWLKRQPDLPKATVLPLLFAAVYTLVGAVVPTPVDELFVDAIAVAASVAVAGSRPKSIPPPSTDATAVPAPPPPKNDSLL